MFVALWAVTLISFFIINLPEGDYVTAYIAQLQATGSMVDAEEAVNLRKFYGLDKPLYVQYLKWMNQIFLQQNLGFSFEYNMPVTEVISERLLLTIVLAIFLCYFYLGHCNTVRYTFCCKAVLSVGLLIYIFGFCRFSYP